MAKLTIVSRPITKTSSAHLLLENEDRSLVKYVLGRGEPISINVVKPDKKRCVGWYNVSTHENHICDGDRTVDLKYDSCFECRQKTGFNPAFYNTSELSAVQTEYNNKPHSVYVSYFGDGLAKAGMMSDSRGLERLYEQGALFYCIIGSFSNADKAHAMESGLIASGLKNSVTKRQKEKVLAKPLDYEHEQSAFSAILDKLDLTGKTVVSNLDHFFFGDYPNREIKPLGENPVSGTILGIVGRYLILENNGRLYGFWLSNLSGFEVEIEKDIKIIEAEPEQASLFG